MSNISSILSVARTAIATNQAAMQTVSHNIANAETAGYSRQRTELVPSTPLRLPFGSLGTGVEIADVVRARDLLLDISYRGESAATDGAGVRRDLLQRVEAMLNEPSDQGLTATLDAFWNSWSDLGNNPTSASSRGVVRQRGAQVASMLRSYSVQLDAIVNGARERLGQAVSEINAHLENLAALNAQITLAETGGTEAPDLRDARDRVADALAALGIPRTEIQADGSYSVYLGGLALVSGSTSKSLEVRTASSVTLGIVGDPDPISGLTGILGALTDFMNTDAPALQSQLDDLARGIVNGVNEYHASGWTQAGDALGGANWVPANGPTGSRVNFFDAAGTTARAMALSSEVLADIAVIAAGDVQNAPGNETVAHAIAALRDGSGMADLAVRLGANYASQIGLPPAVSYGEYYRQAVAGVGLKVADASREQSVHLTIASNIDARRNGVSGVSLDEELTKMMQYQQAYTAATRIVRAVDDMMSALLQMV